MASSSPSRFAGVTERHGLLREQLKAAMLPDEASWPPGWRRLVDLVHLAYCQSDATCRQLEHSLDLRSQELLQADRDMQAVEQVFPEVFLWLSPDGTVVEYRGHQTPHLPAPSCLIGNRIQDVLADQGGDRFTDALQRVGSGSYQVTFEFALGCVQYAARMVRLGDNRILGLLRETTERRDAELASLEQQDRLNRSQKLEAIGLLAGGVAHDFNNVLTAINGYSSMLLEAELPGESRDLVVRIGKAADSAASLTGQLLAFSRQQALQPRVVDLNATIANIEMLFSQLMGEDLDLVLLLNAVDNVTVDPGQLEQVIMNLALNARDAMPRGGTLTIETANVPHGTDGTPLHRFGANGPHVLLAVTDTGVGMDAETQERIFEPFFTTKGAGEGTGLGLATVYGIVKQSGGFIWVDSNLGRGTTFKVLLPSTLAAAPAVIAPVPAGAALEGTETILLTEDQPEVRAVTVMMLELRGFKVLAAASGLEALEIARRHQGAIDLLLTDVVMPCMNGSELADRIALVRPGIRVLYASGYTDDHALRRKVFDSGGSFIQKPFTLPSLITKVREVLDRTGPLPPMPFDATDGDDLYA